MFIRSTLSVVIPTFNVSKILDRCLKSIEWANEIIIVDMGSTDETLEIARKFKANIIHNKPKDGNFDKNREIGMRKAKSDWILKLDSDEELSQALQKEIREFLRNPDSQQYSGVYLLNQTLMFGQLIRHGIVKPKSNELRLVRNGKWHYDPFRFHQLITVDGNTDFSKNPYIHYNLRTINEFLAKTNKYTDIDAKFEKRGNLVMRILLAPIRSFLKLYILQKGFMDGEVGFIVSWLYTWYNLVEKIKIWEYSRLSIAEN